MKIDLADLVLPLEFPFAIARESSATAHSLVLTLEYDGLRGLGETAPRPRYYESPASVRQWYADAAIDATSPFQLEELLAHAPPAARCALDLAAHDWIGKRLEVPLWRLLGVDPAATPYTSFTLGLGDIGETLAKLALMRQPKIVKVKLGGAHDIELIEAVRSHYTGTLRVDANEAWDPEHAVEMLRELARFDLELCEQPIAAGSPERLRWVSERSAVPIVADEDARNAADIAQLRGCCAGVNVKLVKTGGIRGALDAIRVARALRLKVMIGCMVESSLLATAAAHLTPLADWADIDGPYLLAEDPYLGVTYDDGGKLLLPGGDGIGVVSRPL